MMKTLILSGGNAAMAEVLRVTKPNQQAYAARHGYEYRCADEACYREGSHPSWQKMRMVREALQGFDRVVWLDADTVVTNPHITIDQIEAMQIVRKGDGPAPLIVSTDWTHPMPEDEIKHFSLGNFIARPGVLPLFELAKKRSEWANKALWEQQAIQEEYRANPDIRHLVGIVPRRTLNAVPATEKTTGPEPWQPGDFLCHATWLPMEQRRDILEQKDIECMRQIAQSIPEWHETGMCMDIRHIACLYEILRLTRPKSCLEIGVWQGAATSAFMQALDREQIGRYDACDVGIQQRFLSVVGGRDAVTVHKKTSWQVLDERGKNYDLIFCDGDHGLETCQGETLRVLELKPRIVLSHDTNAYDEGWHCCPGPKHMMETLQKEEWIVVEDHKNRCPHEQSRRGFMAATRDKHTAEALRKAFSLTCY